MGHGMRQKMPDRRPKMPNNAIFARQSLLMGRNAIKCDFPES
jgi:hypothetical protein